MKVVGLATPEELRIQMATDEVLRVLAGLEAERSAVEGRDVKLKSSSSNSDTPAVVEAFRILNGGEADHSANRRLDEPDRSAEKARTDAAQLGGLPRSSPAIGHALRLVRSEKADYSAEGLLMPHSEDSFSSQIEPSVRSKRRFSVFMIATATLVSFGLGVLASQLFQGAGDDSVSASQIAYASMGLEQERQRTAQLETELAAARKDFQAQLQLSGNAIYEQSQLKKSVEAVTAQLQQEREKTAVLMRGLETVHASTAVAKSPREPAVEPGAQLSTSEPKTDPELERLMERANELLAQGNISGGRIVLERAVEMGSAKASFTIAETYDPNVLAGWKTYGTRGDLSKARQFYAKAAAGGVEEAKKRLSSLAQN